MKQNNTARRLDIVLSVMFALLLFGFCVGFIILPDNEFSESENRTLTTFPEFTWERLADGSFSSDINSYFADQFPLRDTLVGIKGVTETLLLRGENNGVLLGKDGQLAVRLFTAYKSRLIKTEDTDYYYTENIAAAIDGLNSYAEHETRPLVTLLPPRTVDVAVSSFSYPSENGDALNRQISGTVSDAAGYIDLLPLMREHYDAGDYVYYRTDHHWTAYGAWLAYEQVMNKWGLSDKIIPYEEFSLEETKGFAGTTWSKAGYKFVKTDTITLPSLGNDKLFETNCLMTVTVKDENGKPAKEKRIYSTFEGWLNRDYLQQKDKYAALLDGTHNEQTVFKTDETNRERLLVVKDSFANAMVPYLVQHFDLVIMNLSGRMTEVSEYAEEYGCSRVLIVYNAANLIEDCNLGSIR